MPEKFFRVLLVLYFVPKKNNEVQVHGTLVPETKNEFKYHPPYRMVIIVVHVLVDMISVALVVQ